MVVVKYVVHGSNEIEGGGVADSLAEVPLIGDSVVIGDGMYGVLARVIDTRVPSILSLQQADGTKPDAIVSVVLKPINNTG